MTTRCPDPEPEPRPCSQCATSYRWRATPRWSRDVGDLTWASNAGHRLDTTAAPPVIWTEQLSCECGFADRLHYVDADLLAQMAAVPVRDDPDVLMIARYEIRRRAYVARHPHGEPV